MAYEKHQWSTGEVLTANKLNNMENGILNNNNTYQKHTWQTGEIITASKLNNIEEGIENNNSSIMIVNAEVDMSIDQTSSSTTYTLRENSVDKTYEQILTAINSGKNVLARISCFYNHQGTSIRALLLNMPLYGIINIEDALNTIIFEQIGIISGSSNKIQQTVFMIAPINIPDTESPYAFRMIENSSSGQLS